MRKIELTVDVNAVVAVIYVSQHRLGHPWDSLGQTEGKKPICSVQKI